jgi:hypothetical protein
MQALGSTGSWKIFTDTSTMILITGMNFNWRKSVMFLARSPRFVFSLTTIVFFVQLSEGSPSQSGRPLCHVQYITETGTNV